MKLLILLNLVLLSSNTVADVDLSAPKTLFTHGLDDGRKLFIVQRILESGPSAKGEPRNRDQPSGNAIRCSVYARFGETEPVDPIWIKTFGSWPNAGATLFELIEAEVVDGHYLVLVYEHGWSIHAEVIDPDAPFGSILHPQAIGSTTKSARSFERTQASELVSGAEPAVRKLGAGALVEGSMRAGDLSITLKGSEAVRFELKRSADGFEWVRISDEWRPASLFEQGHVPTTNPFE